MMIIIFTHRKIWSIPIIVKLYLKSNSIQFQFMLSWFDFNMIQQPYPPPPPLHLQEKYPLKNRKDGLKNTLRLIQAYLYTSKLTQDYLKFQSTNHISKISIDQYSITLISSIKTPGYVSITSSYSSLTGTPPWGTCFSPPGNIFER